MNENERMRVESARDILSALLVEQPEPTVPAPNLPCGVNIDMASYWSQIIPWANVARQAKPWHSGTAAVWNDKRDLDLDKYGMPQRLEEGQIARTLLHRNGGLYPGGVYMTSTGDFDPTPHTLEPRFDAKRYSASNCIEATPSADGICLELHRPMDGELDLFQGIGRDYEYINPAFLNLLKPFGVIRTMDLQRINGQDWQPNPITRLDDYVPYDHWTWDVPGGPPIRALCEICNEANTALWFCVPHQAYGYAEAMAREIKEHLALHLPVYVEYSNEVWNGRFPQSPWVLQEARGAHIPGNNDAEKRAHNYADNAAICARAFKHELGDDRVIGVMASQAANPGLSRRLLEFKGAHEVVDALAIAPYFGGELGQVDRVADVREWSADRLFNYLRYDSIAIARHYMEQQKAIADEFGVRLIAYEGGQHLKAASVAPDDPINALFDAANRDDDMGYVYRIYLANWDEISGDTMCLYSLCAAPSHHGGWGLVESMLQNPYDALKYRAVAGWSKSHE